MGDGHPPHQHLGRQALHQAHSGCLLATRVANIPFIKKTIRKLSRKHYTEFRIQLLFYTLGKGMRLQTSPAAPETTNQIKPNTMKKTTLLGAAFVAASIATSQAVIVTHYGLNNVLTADGVGANLTASNANDHDAHGFSGFNAPEGSNWLQYRNNLVTDTTTPGVSDIQLSFNIEVGSGFQLALDATDSVTWTLGALDFQSNTVYNAYAKLFVASDAAFTNILAQSSVFTLATDASNAPVTTSANLDSAVSSTGTLYFGIALGDDSNVFPPDTGGLDHTTRLDDITVNGTITTIPEPSSTALLGLGGLALILRRRK